MSKDPGWVDVFICNAAEAACRIDSALLGAVGSWLAAVATAAAVWFSYSVSKRAAKETSELRRKLSTAVATEISADMVSVEAWMVAILRICDATEPDARARLREVVGKVLKIQTSAIDRCRADLHHMPAVALTDVKIAMVALDQLRGACGSLSKRLNYVDEAVAAGQLGQIRATAESCRAMAHSFTQALFPPVRDVAKQVSS